MREQFSLQGKNALVIGASNSLGRAAAVALAEAGANVGVTTTTRAHGEEVTANSCANEIWALNRKGFAQAIDAAEEADVRSAIQRAVSEFGRLGILVNAQDLPFAKPLAEITPSEWRRVIDVNLTGVYLACRASGEVMLPHGSGRIINVSTILGERGMVNGSAYCAAQAGVLNLTRALALSGRGTGSRSTPSAPAGPRVWASLAARRTSSSSSVTSRTSASRAPTRSQERQSTWRQTRRRTSPAR